MAYQLTMMVKRLTLNKANANPHFIGSWFIENSLCNKLIDYFETNKYKQKLGQSASGLNQKVKDRIDIQINAKDIDTEGNEIFIKYFERLFECYKDYNAQWPFLQTMIRNLDIGPCNLGRYNEGQHYQGLHCERGSIDNLSRLFAFMTYLNNVEQGGSTYFKHYDLEINPQQGLTLIWPAEWTHAHKGNIIKKGSKYIITGWMHIT